MVFAASLTRTLRCLLVLLVFAFSFSNAQAQKADTIPAPAPGQPKLDAGADQPSSSETQTVTRNFTPAPAEKPVDRSLLKRPEDFAPAERIIVGRDAREFRKPGSLLESARGDLPQVDTDRLTERKLSMFEGKRFAASMTVPGQSRWLPESSNFRATPPQNKRSGYSSFATLVLIAILGLGVLFLLIRAGLFERRPDDNPRPEKKSPRMKVHLVDR